MERAWSTKLAAVSACLLAVIQRAKSVEILMFVRKAVSVSQALYMMVPVLAIVAASVDARFQSRGMPTSM